MMKPFLRYLLLISLLAGVIRGSPAVVADAIVQFDSSAKIGSIVGHKVALYRSDGTFTVLRGVSQVSAQPQYTYSYSGTYTFIPAAAGEREAVLTSSSTATETLRLVYSDDLSGSALGNLSLNNSFRVYPHINISGASNVSNRVYVTETHISITGFVISGNRGKWVLIRGVGPTLRNFGVEAAAPETSLEIHSGTNSFASAGTWDSDANLSEGYRALFQYVGAFPLSASSRDSALFIFLSPGAYTVHSRATAGPGEILTEVYILSNED